MPLFSILISGGGDFLAEGSFLGTSKCEGMLLLLWLVGRLAWANSCFTTTGGNTVLLVITFFDVEGIVDGVLPRKVMQNYLKKFGKLLDSGKLTKQAAAQCLKITQNVAFEFLNFGIFHNFCPIKTDLSGNSV